MRKLYEKSEITFALAWIGAYVVLLNIALQICGGFDNLAQKTVPQLLAPVVCVIALAAASTAWIVRNGLAEKFGLCAFRGSRRAFAWFIPLIAVSCVNLRNGLALAAPLDVTLLMTVNMAVAGYVEEVIFRGFLFRAMAKDKLRSAVIVSAVTFGAGHIVNLANTADAAGVLFQVCYAIAIGLMYTVVVYKGGSLWPCIASHMFVNGSSVFAAEHGPFTELVAAVFGQAPTVLLQGCTAALIILISGLYALWVWKKA